ncbi:hypothetical protein [Sulfuricurvum sp.]|uniref:hypothetical protein n=1 Tax=Sulfuricurvum sp. TaxID=2025608 RepID=UPI0026390505|nr:hypothetical protein [Sulfuricurvum sp.]MDD3595891.1 hypothetical protein [Sulfuricurvum sp.]
MYSNHQEGFEDEKKFHEALYYTVARFNGFQTAHLKYILRLFDPQLVDRLFTRKECIRTLKYIGKSNERYTNGNFYQSTTFNGATYQAIDDNREITGMGSAYFERIS